MFACESGEFECNYPADGCIAWDKVYDGRIDCLRDGSDENSLSRKALFYKMHPDGKMYFWCSCLAVSRLAFTCNCMCISYMSMPTDSVPIAGITAILFQDIGFATVVQ